MSIPWSDVSFNFDAARYRLGLLCPEGHNWGGSGMSLRFKATGNCVECERAAARKRAGVSPAKPVKPGQEYQIPFWEPKTPQEQLLRVMALQKSYTGACVVVFLLYFLWVIPGLVAHWLYLQDAKRMEAIAGAPLPGVPVLEGSWKGMLLVPVAFVCLLLLCMIFNAATGQ